MTDDELRGLVRDAVLRHLGGGQPPVATLSHHATPGRTSTHAAPVVHASHVRYLTLANGGDACLIEPSVACNHCGYCLSHGH